MTLSCNKHASLLIVNIIEHLLYAWSYTFTRMISFNFYNHPFKLSIIIILIVERQKLRHREVT